MPAKYFANALALYLGWHLVAVPPASRAQAFRVKDINTTTQGSDPAELVSFGGRVLYRALAPGLGTEIWVSDGSAAGTHLLKDITPGAEGSFPTGLTVLNNAVFFVAREQLWRTDGTEPGTFVVDGRISGYIQNLVDVNGTLFLAAGRKAPNGSCPNELWRTDGTPAGTVLLKRFAQRGLESHICSREFAAVGDRLFFQASDGPEGGALWKSDGTADGTVLVKDIDPTAYNYPIESLTDVDGVLFFVGNGREVWKSDGTAAGTVLVRRLAEPAVQTVPHELTSFHGRLFFVVNDGVHGEELWATDGTADGTRLVRDIFPGSDDSRPEELAVFNGRLVFNADDGLHGSELWESDGTPDGTRLVADIRPGADSGYPQRLTVHGEKLFFVAAGVVGDELWTSDGTAAGTVRLAAIDAEPSAHGHRHGPALDELTSAGSFLFFRAKAKGYGAELWRSDGTAAGTMLVEDVNTISNSSWPSNLTEVAGTLYFTAFDNTYRQRLWRSDGTAAGTRFVGEIGAMSPLSSSSRVSRYAPRTHPPPPPPIAALAAIEPTLFVSAWAPGVGYELWKSNGTAPGTVLVKDIVPGPQSSYPHSLVDLRGAALFVADEAEVWRSDGTAAGTAPVIQFERTDVRLSDLLVSADGAFFTHAEPTGTTLWQTDGTAAGTQPVKRVGDGDAALSGVWRFGDTTVFATVNRSIAMLWRTDGSETGTVPLHAATVLYEGIFGGAAARADMLLFSATDGTGAELWRTDGTVAGTTRVKDIRVGDAGSLPRWFTTIGDVVFFSADDGVHGEELWRSDGTESGTTLVRDIYVGEHASNPIGLTAANGWLFFAACEASGCGLWESDGTAARTERVTGVSWGPESYDLSELVPSGDFVFFRFGGVDGEELWAARVAGVPGCGGDCNGDQAVRIDDLLTMVNVVLGNQVVGDCVGGDANADGRITIDEVVQAVRAVLAGCTPQEADVGPGLDSDVALSSARCRPLRIPADLTVSVAIR